MAYTAQETKTNHEAATYRVTIGIDGTTDEHGRAFMCWDAVPKQDIVCVPNAMRKFVARENRDKLAAWSEKIDSLRTRLCTMKNLLEESGERLSRLGEMCDDLEQKMEDRQLAMKRSKFQGEIERTNQREREADNTIWQKGCLLYTSDAADEMD